MGLFDSFEIGKKALAAHQTGLQVAGNNIANVNTPGYHRQTALLETTPPLQTAAGEIGTGVQVATISSARDQFLETRIAQSTQSAGKQEAIVGYLSQVEASFPANDSNLQDGISKFFNSFSALSADPTSVSLRYGVLSAAKTVAATFQSASGKLVDIRSSSNAAVVDTVREINSLTAKIADLNQNIVAGEVDGTEASTLRDQRTEAVNALAAAVDIHYYEADDGSLSISTTGGDTLVTANFAATVQTETEPPNGFASIHLGLHDITASISGGKLGGLLEVRDNLIPAYQSDLDTLADSIITRVNGLHRTGKDLQVPPTAASLNLFTPVAAAAGAASAFSVNPTVAADPRYIAAGQSGSPGDNANALAIAQLASQKLLAGATQTFAEAFGSLQFKIGTDQQSATTQSETENSLLTQLNNSRDSVSAVSLDEEAIDLIRFQRAYQASARFISIIDQLTGELIQNLGG